MVFGAKEIRKQVLRQNLASFARSIVLFVGGRNLAKQLAEMDERIGDLLAWNRTVQGKQPPRKKSQHGSRKNKKRTGEASNTRILPNTVENISSEV
jgi:hypothetical protein